LEGRGKRACAPLRAEASSAAATVTFFSGASSGAAAHHGDGGFSASALFLLTPTTRQCDAGTFLIIIISEAPAAQSIGAIF
jgi:hypothetical protein